LNQIDDLKSDDDEPVQKKTKFTKTDQMDLTDSDTEEFLSPPTFSIKNFSPTIPVGQLSKFSMQASNASPSSLVIGVTLKGPIQLDGYVVKENDLLYRISVFPTRVGDYSLVINVDNKPIPNVPSQIKVTKDITTTTTTTTTAHDNDDETASLVFGDTLLEKHKGKATVPQGKIEKNSDLGKKSKNEKIPLDTATNINKSKSSEDIMMDYPAKKKQLESQKNMFIYPNNPFSSPSLDSPTMDSLPSFPSPKPKAKTVEKNPTKSLTTQGKNITNPSGKNLFNNILAKNLQGTPKNLPGGKNQSKMDLSPDSENDHYWDDDEGKINRDDEELDPRVLNEISPQEKTIKGNNEKKTRKSHKQQKQNMDESNEETVF